MKVSAFALVLLTIPFQAKAQDSAIFDRNGSFTNSYVCETTVLNKVASDTSTKKWNGSISQEKRSYNIDVVSAYSDNEKHNAKATQYQLKRLAKGKEISLCFQRDHASFHASGDVVITISGTLECEMDGDRGATDRWSFHFETGRFLRVRSEGYVNGEDGYVPGPEMELGTCRPQ
ncbi:hypothetical protein IFT59_07575 [Rhizobium sp. CFBP 8752]|uniref:hypothetical protein n=1 Tax=Rhizobium sp. CFBP 8752 TaxID=2775301 RepID=UPI00177D7943|nr:hypothetical protein [Rhizobium sp. CFBP 8752]MBD8663111.1 hypothetical protein [Rhizobium sp. CFBP 8752]